MFSSNYPGALGDLDQIVQAQANVAGHLFGPNAEAFSAAGLPLRGGQNPNNQAGRSARNSSEAGASDELEDINASSHPPEVSEENTTGCWICDEEKKKAFQFLRTGLWDQTWANSSQNGLGYSLADPENWPGDQIFSYDTDPGVGSGIFAEPEGMVWHPCGRLILVHRMSTTPDLFTVVAIRVLVLEPQAGTDDWVLYDSATIELEVDRDQDISSRPPDNKVCLDLNLNRLTILSSPRDLYPSGATSSDQASVWSLDIGDDASLGEVTFSEFTVGTNKTATRMSVAGPFMAKLDGDTYYGQVAEGGWSDLWEVDWQDALAEVIESFDQAFVGGISSVGYPLLQRGDQLTWCTVCSTSRYQEALGSADGGSGHCNARLFELQFDLRTGALVSVVNLWSKDNYRRDEVPKVEDLIEAAADAFLTAFPSQDSYTEVVPTTTMCSEDSVTYSYDWTRQHTWLGVFYADHAYDIVAGGTTHYTYYFPGGSPLTNPLNSLDDLAGVRPAPPPLPASGPNLRPHTDGEENKLRQYWDGSPFAADSIYFNPGGEARLVTSSDGWRYCASLIPTPYYGPTFDEYRNDTSPISSTATFGACWFETEKLSFSGLVPQIRFLYETFLFAVSPDNQVFRAPLLPRHTGVRFEGEPTSMELPIPENVYQPICIEELGCVFWLHDMRASADEDPMPTITATNRQLEVLYRIPASEMVPTDTFSSDQVVTGDTTVWALEGEAQYRYHREKPVMKAFKTPEGFYLVVGIEFDQRAEPTTGTAGETTQRTCIFKVGASGYSPVQSNDANQSWTYPNIAGPGMVEGPRVVRSLAIGPRLVVAQNGPTLKQII